MRNHVRLFSSHGAGFELWQREESGRGERDRGGIGPNSKEKIGLCAEIRWADRGRGAGVEIPMRFLSLCQELEIKPTACPESVGTGMILKSDFVLRACLPCSDNRKRVTCPRSAISFAFAREKFSKPRGHTVNDRTDTVSFQRCGFTCTSFPVMAPAFSFGNERN